jgi:DNA-directed RNA polymerase subunit RPC12/RpoP
MSLRLRCRNCQAAFVTSKDQVGQSVECPKCGAPQVVPRPKPVADPGGGEYVESGPALTRIKAAAPSAPEKSSVFIKKDKGKGKKGESQPANKGLLALGILVPILIVGAVIAWPMIRDWLDPRPKNPVEGAAYDYLVALKEGNEPEIARLGVVEDPPEIRSFRDIKRDKPRNVEIKGSFKPIATLHRAIEKQFVYDPSIGRFTPKNPLGAAAETLDALHDAKDKAVKDKTYEKMASGDPEEAMQAAIDFGEVFAKLSDGVLNPKRLIPTYKKLLMGAKPPLTGNELDLALEYANHRETWDRMLKRPFPTIKTNSPYVYQKAEVTVQVQDRLGSSGDPPTTVRLKLVNFVMDGIDTRWKVVSARRITPGAPDLPDEDEDPEPKMPTEPIKPSPGDLPASPGLNIEGLPVDIPKVEIPK